MPRSINGTGTAFYGRALVEPDGSYVVTEWITFLWLPLLPLSTRRVWYQGHENNWFWNQSMAHYKAVNVDVYWPQIAWGYAITVGVLGGFWLLGHQDWISDNLDWLLPIAVALLAVSTVAILMFKRRHRAPESADSGLDPFGWTKPQQAALLLAAGIGAVIGVAIAYVLTGERGSFAYWITDQGYTGWPALGWGMLGLVLGPALVFVVRAMR